MVNWQGVGGGHSLVVILVNFGLKKRVEEVKVLKRREMNEKGWVYIHYSSTISKLVWNKLKEGRGHIVKYF